MKKVNENICCIIVMILCIIVFCFCNGQIKHIRNHFTNTVNTYNGTITDIYKENKFYRSTSGIRRKTETWAEVDINGKKYTLILSKNRWTNQKKGDAIKCFEYNGTYYGNLSLLSYQNSYLKDYYIALFCSVLIITLVILDILSQSMKARKSFNN